ncbi:MAG: outer membrane lipoprotein carrier protein LolA [Candidatus Solibacter sp.]|nr:outer membrane lipoprotein carrier protein LolA [Candidatus Solibacter sp.]
MSWFRTLSVLSGAVLAHAASSLGAPPADAALDAVLARLDQASLNFKGLTADIKKVSHTDVVNVDAVDSGTIIVKRFKPRDIRIRVDFVSPRRQNVTVGGGKAQLFNPQSNEAQELDLGKNRGVVDQFMLLGFGSNSADLKNAYSVALGGADSIDGEKTTRIVLVPKDPEVLAQVKKCEIWVSDKGWTVQQKFYTGGGDYVLSTYTRMNLNPSIADAALKLELPKGVKFGKLK